LASNIVFSVPTPHTPSKPLWYPKYNRHIHFVNGVSSCVVCREFLGLGLGLGYQG